MSVSFPSRCVARMGVVGSPGGVFVVPVILVWCAAVTGCAETDSVVYYDSDSLEDAIPGELVPDQPGIVTDVECPEMVERRSVSMLCNAKIGGVAVDVIVDIDERGRADITTGNVFLLEVDELASSSARRLESDGFGPIEVECHGPSVLVAVVSHKLECDAVHPSGDRHPLVVTITSDRGDWRLDMPPD